MSNILNRIKRLEGSQVDNQTCVYIFSWLGSLDERTRIKFNGVCIERINNEDEQEYLKRAKIEIRRIAEPNKKTLTAFAFY